MKHKTEPAGTGLLRSLGGKKPLRLGLQLTVLLGVSFLEAFQLHYSLARGFAEFFRFSPALILLNTGILLWVNLAVKLLLQKWYWSIPVTAALTTAWSVGNFYVVKFHGSPLYFSEFANFRTAMNVLGGYSLQWERRITWMLLLGVACCGAGLLLRLFRQRGLRFWSLRQFLWSLGAFCGVSLLLWLSLFVWQKPKPRETVAWTWRDGVYVYGYPSSIVEDVDRSIHYLIQPEGYDAAHLDSLKPRTDQSLPAECPDIILIINETFCDLADYMPFSTDVDYLEAFYNLPGAVIGKAAIPHVGGGTNNTEFEVLTGNSMSLLTMYAPFNYVSLNRDDTNAARYLKSLGYRSAALHCEPGSNYSRNRAYPAMGFDQVVMGNENFLCRSYGKRRNLDEDNYQDMLRVGESLGEGPRFLYLLTFQNHGGWESNEPEYDTVHVQEDFGDLTDDLNEYLTSIRMSAEAFRDLTEELQNAERPTIVCMLGDHAPSFIWNLSPDPSYSDLERELRQKTVPYVIWANFPLELPQPTDYTTSVDLMPMLYRAAGLPTSAYQDYLLELHARLPFRTKGAYRDRTGEPGTWEPGSAESALLQTYYELEYNALSRGPDYRRSLFTCPMAAQGGEE